jgi:hypothetical protein
VQVKVREWYSQPEVLSELPDAELRTRVRCLEDAWRPLKGICTEDDTKAPRARLAALKAEILWRQMQIPSWENDGGADTTPRPAEPESAKPVTCVARDHQDGMTELELHGTRVRRLDEHIRRAKEAPVDQRRYRKQKAFIQGLAREWKVPETTIARAFYRWKRRDGSRGHAYVNRIEEAIDKLN